ncbi:hypothetical protein QR680_006016 [Steinernema hermaphroditum]|uniref:C-type lectin domain-containing protein n=1 Tax=Steinernema hermaphroditum TaxID=289476 RepID=A0AA39LWD2_9BILA|nr:hypothetical protein QR680_006016 [Steinernema hermaphroditum]
MRLLLTALLFLSPLAIQAIPRTTCENARVGDHCFQVQSQLATFSEAQQFCQTLGGNLSSIRDEYENMIVSHITYTLIHDGLKAGLFWIGGQFTNSRWVWRDGKPLTFQNFAKISDLKKPAFPCLSINGTEGINYKATWVPSVCDQKAPFVCEIVLRRTSCEGQTQPCFNGNLYIVNRHELTWEDAEQFCYNQNGHLSSIHSKEEADFVATQMKEANVFDLWIGGQRYEGKFHWVDNSAWDYTDYSIGQPNDVSINKCLEIFDASFKKWMNYDCDREYASICKIPL